MQCFVGGLNGSSGRGCSQPAVILRVTAFRFTLEIMIIEGSFFSVDKGDLELFEEAQANREDNPAAATSEREEADFDDSHPITVQPKAATYSPSE